MSIDRREKTVAIFHSTKFKMNVYFETTSAKYVSRLLIVIFYFSFFLHIMFIKKIIYFKKILKSVFVLLFFSMSVNIKTQSLNPIRPDPFKSTL